jgi:hypothetical protein
MKRTTCPKKLGLKKVTWRNILLVLVLSLAALNCAELHRFTQPEDNPVILHVHAQAITPTPTPTHEQIVLNAKHGDILYRVWNNETGRGTSRSTDPTALHTYCKNKGMTNEFGYDPQDKLCFPTFQDSVNTVSAWWDKCLKNSTLLACIHSYSGNTPSYVTKFLNQ